MDLQQIALIMVSLAYIRQFLFPLPPLFLGIPFINISWLFTTSSFMSTWSASIASTINLTTSLFCLRGRYIDDNKLIFCGENITYFLMQTLKSMKTLHLVMLVLHHLPNISLASSFSITYIKNLSVCILL